MLELHSVNSFYGSSHVLFDIDLSVNRGECVAVLGRNGAGKSTLLKTIMGAVKARSGQIVLDKREIQAEKPEKIAGLGVQLVPDSRNIFNNLTVKENLMLAGLTIDDPMPLRKIYEMFPRLGERSKNRGRALSGGEQQMLAIARALVRRPQIILLDEPFEGLAPSIVDSLLDICRMLVNQRQTVVIVEQDLEAVLELSSRCYVLNNGQVAFKGSNLELRESPDVVSKYLGA